MSDFSSETSLSSADAPLKDLDSSMNRAAGADNPHEKNRLKRFKVWMADQKESQKFRQGGGTSSK